MAYAPCVKLCLMIAACIILEVKGMPGCPVADGCIDIPKNEHIMTKAEFIEKISRQLVTTIFRIEGPKFDDFLYRLQCRFSIGNEDHLVLGARLRNGSAADACVGFFNITSTSPIGNTMVADLRTQGDNTVTRYWFLAKKPYRHFYFFGCRDKNDIQGNKCNGPFYIDIVLNGKSPTSLDIDLIDCELQEIFGIKLTDPRTRYLYIRDECPNEFPPLPCDD